ncbi:GAF and ANTAR domain-containing protein [Microlunatus ginsengisoli]|uniref:GAF and ANTAR domain-containing protein n=1 Tax=Microlunatus ginsengisoli TaxID=363863 RepID=A0ABP7AY38_9ACTN
MDQTRPGTGGRGQPSTSDTGTADIDVLAEGLSALARDLEEHDDPDAILAAIVPAAVAMVPGADEGSISIVLDRRRASSQAATGDLPTLIDAIQNETQQGPCLDSAYEQQTVRVDNLATEQRWPLFSRRASEAGAASMLSLQLYVEGDNLGALNLFSRSPEAFTDESEQIGLLFAAHAAIAYVGAKKQAQLIHALTSRDLIGQAKGILMERYKISGERAFLLLVRLSQDNNRKLVDLADELARSRTITTSRSDPI